MSTVHVRQGVRAFNGGFLSIPITTPEPSTIRGPDYVYFLLHRLIGDIIWMAGGVETLKENKFQDDDDPWTESHLVSPFSISFLDKRLERLQDVTEEDWSASSSCFLKDNVMLNVNTYEDGLKYPEAESGNKVPKKSCLNFHQKFLTVMIVWS